MKRETLLLLIVAVTANITSVFSRTKKRPPRQPNLIRNKSSLRVSGRDTISQDTEAQIQEA